MTCPNPHFIMAAQVEVADEVDGHAEDRHRALRAFAVGLLLFKGAKKGWQYV